MVNLRVLLVDSGDCRAVASSWALAIARKSTAGEWSCMALAFRYLLLGSLLL